MSHAAPCRLSICICTFNGAGRVGEVIEALGAQSDAADGWEVVVVDNASTDGTGAMAAAALDAHVPGRGRVVREGQPGLMHARRRATREARGDFMVFLDDDNIPAPDYIAEVQRAAERHPKAGVLGGKVVAEWLGEPDPLGVAVADFALAICDRGDAAFAYTDVTGGPAGAGMVVSRTLMEQIFEEQDLAGRVAGRTGTSLLSGEDTAIVIRAHQLGYAVRYEPKLRVGHRIPTARTQRAYLLRLYEGIGRGQAAMRPLYDTRARHPVLGTLIALKEGLRWLCGTVAGPDAALRARHGSLAGDVHRLQQRQVWGRFQQGLREALR